MKTSTYMYKFILSALLMMQMNIVTAQIIDAGEIKFKRGSSSKTVSGTVVRGYSDEYSLGAGAGQWMEVKIKSEENNAVFQLSIYQYGTGKEVQLDGAKDGDDASYWYGKLPTPGYSKDGSEHALSIVVGGTRGNASYNLTVTIKNHNWKVKPSFNCKKASSKVDRMICDDADLSAADRKMVTVYKRLLKVLPKHERNLLKADQRQWLKDRNRHFLENDQRFISNENFYLLRIKVLAPVSQAGFNCKKAATSVERKICRSRLLKHADGRLAAVYKELMSKTDKEDKAYYIQEQRDWLKSRNKKLKYRSCGTKCAWKFYTDQIEVMEGALWRY